MFTHFTKEEKAVHDPPDRRAFIAVKPYMMVIFVIIILGVIATAWIQYLLTGLPADPSLYISSTKASEPTGFPLWLNLSHWVNFFFLVLIIRSGLSILVDHPRLYWNNGCAPATEWIRFTPLKIPKDKSWTAKEDARYISPLAGLPGYRHSIGIAEHQRAKIFAASMIQDLKADTAQLRHYNKYYKYAADNIDTLMQMLTVNDLKNISSGKLYWYGLWGGAAGSFIPDDATFQQMKSSGALSYFKTNIATDVAKYDRWCRQLQSAEEMDNNVYTEVRKARAKIFEYKYNEMANDVEQKNRIVFNQASIDSFINTNPPLLSYDKTLFNEYAELVRSRFIRNYNVAYSDSLLKQANIVLDELNKEYHH